MSRLIIVGAGGHGKVCADVAELMGKWDEIVFVDRKFPEVECCGVWPVVASNLETSGLSNSSFFVAIGDNHIRNKVHAAYVGSGAKPVTLIHPRAILARDVHVGVGSVVCAGAVVNVGSMIGECCIVNTGATIDHDCLLENAVHLSPGVHLAGEVKIGSYSWLGTGVATKQLINIGSNVVVGVGAAVVKDCIEPGIYAGVPAQLMN